MNQDAIAGLPMYDWPEVAGHVDELWATIRDELLARGIDAPAELSRPENLEKVREILFGNQVRTFDKQIDQVADRLSADLQASSKSLRSATALSSVSSKKSCPVSTRR